MEKEIRRLPWSGGPGLEAYRFTDLAQSFPNHFHDYYVIGLVEYGARCLSWRGRTYLLRPGDILLFNPNDTHGCTPWGTEPFAYRGLNIPRAAMAALCQSITGEAAPWVFSQPVLSGASVQAKLQAFHQKALSGGGKVEALLPLLTLLLEQYGRPSSPAIPDCEAEIEAACRFMEQQYAQHITLDQLCRCTNLSKSTLRRAFVKAKGVTPYRYLQAVRIDRAKALLEQGVSPSDTALETGFADQSHFTNFFQRYIGLSPAAYRRSVRPTPEVPAHEP